MSKSLIELARRVKSESGRSGTGPLSVATASDDDMRIINAVRDAWNELQLEPRWWKWMRRTKADATLAAGQVAHTLAGLGITDFSAWWPESDDYWPTCYVAGDQANEWRLRELPYERFRARFIVGEHEAGAPQFYAISPAGDLLLGPKPDSDDYRVRIDHQAEPTELVADEDEPAMPGRFHDALIWLALMPIAVADAAPEHYARGRDKSDDLVEKLRTDQGAAITLSARPLA